MALSTKEFRPGDAEAGLPPCWVIGLIVLAELLRPRIRPLVARAHH